MCDLCFAKARSVVFKRKLALRVVDGEAAKAVRICEFAERAKLRVRERRLQFKFYFEERHTQIIAEIQNRERQLRVKDRKVRVELREVVLCSPMKVEAEKFACFQNSCGALDLNRGWGYK